MRYALMVDGTAIVAAALRTHYQSSLFPSMASILPIASVARTCLVIRLSSLGSIGMRIPRAAPLGLLLYSCWSPAWSLCLAIDSLGTLGF